MVSACFACLEFMNIFPLLYSRCRWRGDEGNAADAIDTAHVGKWRRRLRTTAATPSGLPPRGTSPRITRLTVRRPGRATSGLPTGTGAQDSSAPPRRWRSEHTLLPRRRRPRRQDRERGFAHFGTACMKKACTKPAQQEDTVSRRDTSKGLRHPRTVRLRLRQLQRMIAQDCNRDRDHVTIADE